MSISERILKKREELGISQTELAKRAGLKPPAISQYESGLRNPSYEALIKLSAALDLSTDYLVSGNEISYEVANNQSAKQLLKIINFLSTDERDKLLDYAIFLMQKNTNTTFPILSNASDYAEYILSNIYTDRFPIDIVEIAKLLNITIYYQNTETEYEGILIKGKENIILLNTSIDNANRKKFTISMLIAHAVIPWHVKSNYAIRKAGTSTFLTEDPEEMEAQNFAANLIMPRFHLDNDFNKNDLSLEEITKLSEEKYYVSVSALLHRLVEYNKNKYAVIQSKDWKITSVHQGNRLVVDKININSIAATFFNSPINSQEIRKGIIPSSNWFTDYKENEVILEQSSFHPKYGVLTLLTVQDMY